MRTEHDELGPVEVPAEAPYGAHTARALANFAVPGPTMGDRPDLVVAYLRVKLAAVQANRDCGVLEHDVAGAIASACRELLSRSRPDAFPQPVVQGGGGTASNMGVNEVVARLAGVRPDQVNRSQSTNDTYPTVLHVICIEAAAELADGLDHLADAYDTAASRHDPGDLRLGRTCLNDALPVPIATTLESRGASLRHLAAQVRDRADDLLAVPLGATAVGTGVGAPAGYADLAVTHLAQETGLALRPAHDPFDALANFDHIVAVGDVLERAAIVLDRLARDVRWLASGPVGGIGELQLPAVQVGSSIMPGKSNPVMPELVMQVALQARGVAHVVRGAAALGELELNIMEPVVAAELPPAMRRLGATARLFADRCVAGLEWNLDRVAANLAGSKLAATEAAVRDGHPTSTDVHPPT